MNIIKIIYVPMYDRVTGFAYFARKWIYGCIGGMYLLA